MKTKIVIAILALGVVFQIGVNAFQSADKRDLRKANSALRQENVKLKAALQDMSAADARLKAADLVLKGNCSELQQANERLSIVARLSSDQLRRDIATFQRLRREGCR